VQASCIPREEKRSDIEDGRWKEVSDREAEVGGYEDAERE
jgi:hypothetical protein